MTTSEPPAVLDDETKDEMVLRHKKELKSLDGERRAALKKTKSTAGKGKKGKEILTRYVIIYKTSLNLNLILLVVFCCTVAASCAQLLLLVPTFVSYQCIKPSQVESSQVKSSKQNKQNDDSRYRWGREEKLNEYMLWYGCPPAPAPLLCCQWNY